MQGIIRQISTYLLTAFILFSSQALYADVAKSVTGRLNLMAMIDEKPAFRPVRWTVTKNGHFVRALTRHTASIDLEPGNYLVSLSLKNKTRTFKVNIRENQKKSLTVRL